jgi:hypothetical protein
VGDYFSNAERVAAAARALGVETAIIGGSAMAIHHYVRATDDLDLATCTNPYVELRRLEDTLQAQGFKTERRLPDDQDPLGGVLRVWTDVDDEGEPVDLVEVVNFFNPERPRPNPGPRAIRDAVQLDPSTSLRYVQLPDLIALKLYAGEKRDEADIVELLVKNPDADLEAVRATAKPYDEHGKLEELIADAMRRRTSPRR